MASDDIARLSAHELTAQFAGKSLSPVEVAKAMLARIEDLNPKINAFHHVDAEAALASAQASEKRWQQGAPAGPLDGVPTAIKDGLYMKGVPVYRGSAANGGEGQNCEEDAPVVDRLREGGAVILGKTTMCDYGMLASGYSSKFGPTRNPWDLSATSGGSSSGSAAAVAAGICPVIVGTDIVGSVRNPASFCGLVGHKPSFGRVPFYPQSSPAVCAGPIARTVADATLLMNVMVQPDPRDPTALPSNPVDYGAASKGGCSGLRIAVMENIGFGPATNAEVLTLFRAAVERFRAMGNSVEGIAAPFTQEDLQKGERFYQVRALAEMDLLPPDVQALGKVIKDWVEPARAYTGSDHYRDYLGTQELRVTMLDAMRGYDLLLLPTVPVPPYAAENPGLDDGDTFAPWCNTFVFNLTQQPAITVPSGRTAGGLPVGLQIVGRRDDDIGVLKAALAHEAAADLPNGIASP